MAKSGESFAKKEKEKKRLQQRNEKAEKMAERKANGQKGKSLDDMMAYLDEDGNISSRPPDPTRRREYKPEEMQVGVPKQDPKSKDPNRTGVVSYFADGKGFGFINDAETDQRIFVHISHLLTPVQEGDTVNFEVEKGPRGLHAIRVKKV